MILPLFDKAPGGYLSFFDDGTILFVNETLCNHLLYDKDELTGKHVETIFTLPTRIFFQTHLFPLVKMHGHAEEIFLSLLAKDGQHIPVLLNAKRIEWEQKILTTCVYIVVANRKKFEDELVHARKEAERALKENTALINAKEDLQLHAEKLEKQMQTVKKQNHELQQFSHAVSHNLKEPLRKILLYSGMIRANETSPAFNKVIKASEQMKIVVSGLQQYIWLSEKDTRFNRVDLNSVVQNATGMLAQDFDPELFLLTYEDPGFIEGDADQLKLLFYHVLANAVKFKRGEKAIINIESTRLKLNKFRTVENKYEYDDFLRLEVKDEGMGFDSIYREQVFELFKKLNYGEGQGLGLSLCKKIVENHSGFIDADSKINLYTKITISLPIHHSPRLDANRYAHL